MKNDKTSYEPISEIEKANLKERILHSVQRLIVRRKRIRYAIGTAASLVLAIGFGSYYFLSSEPSISDFARTNRNNQPNTSDQVVLTLDNGQNVKVNEKEADITYSASGQQIDVAGQQVSQQTNLQKKTAFNTLFVPYGKRSKLQLSDGTIVWLNSGSKLIYPALFKKDKRQVYLEGEAIFDVAHNPKQPFVVLSEKQELEVLGTVFNVSNYLDDDSSFIALKNGRVRVTYTDSKGTATGKKLDISPGTLASYHKNTQHLDSRKTPMDRYFSWRDGILIFKNDNLHTITRKLARYYKVEIIMEDQALSGETFSGRLDLKENIERVLEIISETTEMKFQRTDNSIHINHQTQTLPMN